jgi:hypothetical protein
VTIASRIISIDGYQQMSSRRLKGKEQGKGKGGERKTKK